MKQGYRSSSRTYSELRADRRWPCIDRWADSYLQMNDLAAEFLGSSRPRPGSIEEHAGTIISKYEKVLKRQASAVQHLCGLLAQLQRPGSKEYKRRIVQVIERRQAEQAALLSRILEAFKESAE